MPSADTIYRVPTPYPDKRTNPHIAVIALVVQQRRDVDGTPYGVRESRTIHVGRDAHIAPLPSNTHRYKKNTPSRCACHPSKEGNFGAAIHMHKRRTLHLHHSINMEVFSMKTPVFTGSSVAIVTPFCDGKVDFNKLGELIDFQIAGGTSAITICGTTGECSTLSLEEHIQVVDFCVKHVNSRVKVIAGTGSNDTMAALFLSQEAEKSGADALMMATPYYNKTTQLGLVKHYTFIADRVSTPIILYNVPSRTGMSFTAETYKELSKHPNINGVKEASGDFSLIAATIAACGDSLYVWSGNDEDVVPMMSIGAKGVISVLANIVPSVVAEMTEACLNNDFKRGAALQLKYLDLINNLFIEVNPMPVKAALNLMGMDVGEPRLPLCELGAGNLEKLRLALIDSALIK